MPCDVAQCDVQIRLWYYGYQDESEPKYPTPLLRLEETEMGLTVAEMDTIQSTSAGGLYVEQQVSGSKVWPRKDGARKWNEFRVGDVVDAKDSYNQWYVRFLMRSWSNVEPC